MAVTICSSCRARNAERGDRLVCGAGLGSLRVAVPAALAEVLEARLED